MSDSTFQEAMDRIQQGTDYGRDDPKPDFDPQQARELREEGRAGRRIGDYHQVLEHYGFTCVPVNKLPLWRDGRARVDDEWRSNKLQLAFTEQDILEGFRGPEDFDTWLQSFILKKQAMAAGLVLP